MKTPDAAAPTNRLGPAPGLSGSRRSTAKGDVPETVLDRYLVERDLRGRPERFFRDHRAAEPMFRDRGGSLVSTQAYPDAVIDMLKIARHRGWEQVRVSGDPAFRREVWIQARTLGMEVQGHRPRERDRQAAGEPRRPPSPDLGARLDRAAVVVRALIADPAAQARLMARAMTRVAERAPQPEKVREQRTRSR